MFVFTAEELSTNKKDFKKTISLFAKVAFICKIT